MPTILFGSISTLADTSDLQRRAFNDAFASHGLDWTWGREAYRSMLADNGGTERIADYAQQRGDDVDAAAMHATKTQRFHELLTEDPVPARPGVLECIRAAEARGAAVAVVTTTSPGNVAAVLNSAALDARAFALVVDADQVDRPKPHPEAYLVALERLAGRAEDCIAIEDNPGGVASATAAGLVCVAWPNENTVGQDFAGAADTIDHLDLDRLLALLEDGR